MNFNVSQFAPAIAAGSFLLLGGYTLSQAVFQVKPGQVAIKFNKITGLSPKPHFEGLNFAIPYLEKPYIYNIKSEYKQYDSRTGTKDLQLIDISIRVIVRPDRTKIHEIHRNLGPDYLEVVLSNLVHDVSKSIISQYNANQLLTQRDQISSLIHRTLIARCMEYHIQLEDTSITNLTFSQEYQRAIENKQISQQHAERYKYEVDKARLEKDRQIIAAQAEATAAVNIGKQIKQNPLYLELRKLQTAKDISAILKNSVNTMYLSNDSLLMDILGSAHDDIRNTKKN